MNFSEGLYYSISLIQLVQSDIISFYDASIQPDWQLQGCCILCVLLAILITAIKLEWEWYGSTITNPNSVDTTTNNYADEHDGELEVFPDEDPLTFLKKTK